MVAFFEALIGADPALRGGWRRFSVFASPKGRRRG